MMSSWWKQGVIYQIYPRSFQDASGDGVGDLRGIRSRLEHCSWLAVDAVWLSPVYPSPMVDFGYDVSDYTGVHPLFGTLAELDDLIAELKQRGLRLILDFVPNHTSDEHRWFQESRASRDNPRRDWYLWRDPASDGGPPNNWLSQFGGSAWELDERTGQYYYHAFLKQQPDLNWRNPQVVEAMHDVLRFWLRRGVDGFRVDVLWHLIKDDQFRDNPASPEWRGGGPPHHSQIPLYTTDRPEVQDIVCGLRNVVNEFEDRVLIGEIYLPLERLVAYYGTDLDGVHLPFNFQLLQTKWNARALATLIDEYEAAIPAGGWPNWVLGNHDNTRIASRVGIDQARIAAVLLLTLRGTPTMYYGDELGMQDVRIPPERVQDPFERNVPGIGVGRDPCRTPMQWDASPNAGFSAVEPWLPVADNFSELNVASETEDPASILNLYRKLLQLRKAHAAFSVGEYEPVAATGDLLAYIRKGAGERFLVALNLGAEPHALSLAPLCATARTLLSTYADRAPGESTRELALRAHEGVIVSLS